MSGALKIVAVTMGLILLAGCSAALDSRDNTTAAIMGGPSYYLSPGDKLKINVFDEPDLTGEFQVDETGKIAFPLVGSIQVSGLTPEDFRLSLIKRLKDGYVRKPRVTIDILNYRPINIIGEVRNAGQYPYRPGISARDAVAIAGGYTYRADEDTLYIMRGLSKEPITVSLNDEYFNILPGDTVKIPERFF